jgi:putative lipase involved disintegration of autophagic bodies
MTLTFFLFVQNGSYGYDHNGVRAQVFGNEQQSLFVIAIKGTSAGVWPGNVYI